MNELIEHENLTVYEELQERLPMQKIHAVYSDGDNHSVAIDPVYIRPQYFVVKLMTEDADEDTFKERLKHPAAFIDKVFEIQSTREKDGASYLDKTLVDDKHRTQGRLLTDTDKILQNDTKNAIGVMLRQEISKDREDIKASLEELYRLMYETDKDDFALVRSPSWQFIVPVLINAFSA